MMYPLSFESDVVRNLINEKQGLVTSMLGMEQRVLLCQKMNNSHVRKSKIGLL
jgi:hypothetical protein